MVPKGSTQPSFDPKRVTPVGRMWYWVFWVRIVHITVSEPWHSCNIQGGRTIQREQNRFMVKKIGWKGYSWFALTQVQQQPPEITKKSSLDLFDLRLPKVAYVKSWASRWSTLVGSKSEFFAARSLKRSLLHLFGMFCILKMSTLLSTAPRYQTVFQSPPIIIWQSLFLSEIPSMRRKKSLPVLLGP